MSKNTEAKTEGAPPSGEPVRRKGSPRRKDAGKLALRKHNGSLTSWKPFPDLTDQQRDEIANEILTRFMNGEQIINIAPDYGVSDRTIYQLLVSEYEEQWRNTQSARALANYGRERTALANAKDAVEVSRATALMKSSQWDLEKLLRRLYGDEKQVNTGAVVSIILDFSGHAGTVDAARTIEQDER